MVLLLSSGFLVRVPPECSSWNSRPFSQRSAHSPSFGFGSARDSVFPRFSNLPNFTAPFRRPHHVFRSPCYYHVKCFWCGAYSCCRPSPCSILLLICLLATKGQMRCKRRCGGARFDGEITVFRCAPVDFFPALRRPPRRFLSLSSPSKARNQSIKVYRREDRGETVANALFFMEKNDGDGRQKTPKMQHYK